MPKAAADRGLSVSEGVPGEAKAGREVIFVRQVQRAIPTWISGERQANWRLRIDSGLKAGHEVSFVHLALVHPCVVLIAHPQRETEAFADAKVVLDEGRPVREHVVVDTTFEVS